MGTGLPYERNELFRKSAEGDHAAFAQMFHYYNARLFSFVKKVTKHAAVAEEIVQEVFLRAWLNRQKLAEMEQPEGWLFLIASNLSLTYLRNAANEARKINAYSKSSSSANTPDFTAKLEGKEIASLIEEAVQRLPPKRQIIFRMSRHDRLSYEEIAEKLCISTNTVKDHLVIALRFVRQHLHQRTGSFFHILAIIKFFHE
ncbi:MAG: RNA polymerase sigma-70 factor [Chitinophagaceae bacterium]|nr:RNA polymerase sigma-70 factor [Chitinophagaceae bacterium]